MPQLEELEQHIEDLKQEITALNSFNDALVKEIEQSAQATPKQQDSFVCDGATYTLSPRFRKSVNHKGKLITPQQVLANTALQHELILMRSSLIKKQ